MAASPARNQNLPDSASVSGASWASSEATRRSMVGNRFRDTTPELRVRSAVHRRGLRYRVAARPLRSLRRTADLVFRPTKVAVFIDGCYWHGCPEHFVLPRTNVEYWSGKIGGNVNRDRETDHALREAGWTVLRFWEHENVDAVVEEIVGVVTARRLAADPGRGSREPYENDEK